LADRAQRYPDVVFFVDSRRRIRLFRHVLVKPNQFEALGIENPEPDAQVDLDALMPAVTGMRAEVGAPVCVTCGPSGIIASDPVPTLVPGVRVEGPTDPTGAGDSATAGIVLALCAGAALAEACLVGNLVASITVQQLATCGTASPGQLPERLARWQEQQTS
jgi:sugar/nucleoside kinase (ribokinase family)